MKNKRIWKGNERNGKIRGKEFKGKLIEKLKSNEKKEIQKKGKVKESKEKKETGRKVRKGNKKEMVRK